MKSIEGIVDRVTAARNGNEHGSNSASVVPLRPAAPPLLPATLQRQVDRLIGESSIPMPSGPVFDPDAGPLIEAQRAATAPADESAIQKWLMVIVKSMAPGPVEPEGVFNGLLLTCGDYPAACWCRATAAEIIGKGPFLPGASEIKKVVQPIADKLTGTLRALERIAAADPATRGTVRFGPARPAAEPYEPPPRPPEMTSPRRMWRAYDAADIDPAEAEAEDREARALARAQLTALGLTTGDAAAALQATNAARETK